MDTPPILEDPIGWRFDNPSVRWGSSADTTGRRARLADLLPVRLDTFKPWVKSGRQCGDACWDRYSRMNK